MKFSFLSWNIRHFDGKDERRVRQVARLIKSKDPDIFGLMEFRAKAGVRQLVTKHFRDYDFGVTDSRQGLEILVGWRRDKFKQAIFTQRRALQVRRLDLRPGALLSVRLGRTFYNLLFIHLDSGETDREYAHRKAMRRKIWHLARALSKAAPNRRANLIVLGDFNCMGNGSTISAATELTYLRNGAAQSGMRFLAKDEATTWRNVAGTQSADLDHVVASDELRFRNIGTRAEPSQVEVMGWHGLGEAKGEEFVRELSDHAGLFAMV